MNNYLHEQLGVISTMTHEMNENVGIAVREQHFSNVYNAVNQSSMDEGEVELF